MSRELHAEYVVLVSRPELPAEAAGGHVPELQEAVVAPREKSESVLAEGAGVDAAVVTHAAVAHPAEGPYGGLAEEERGSR